jgi:predicted RNA-binding Zn-ribbon protein involved in translation (DUF1610 family)
MTHPICPTSGKQQFSTPKAAKDSRNNKWARDGRKAAKGYTYRCPDCGDWHLTRVPPEKFKHRRAS